MTDTESPPEDTQGSASLPAASEKPAKPARPRRQAGPKTAAPGAKAASAKPRKTAKIEAHSRVGHGWIWAAMVAVALISGGSVASIWFLENAARDAQTKRLEAEFKIDDSSQTSQRDGGRISALESRLGDIEHRVASVPTPSSAKEAEAATALLAEKIEGLSGRISDIEKTLAKSGAVSGAVADSAGLEEAKKNAKQAADELQSLKDRLAALEQTTHANASTATVQRNQALVVAVGQLREALSTSKPFTAELASVTSLGDSEIGKITDRIAPFADKGVETLADLRDEFAPVADAVVRAANAPKNPDWIDKAITSASSVVTVRKVGPDVAGATPEAIVARAEQKLANEDLDGALAEMSALSGPPADAAAVWTTKAKARSAAEQTLKDLHQQAIGQIAERDGSAK